MTTDDTPRTTREDATVLVDFCRKASGLPAVYGEESLGYLDVLLTDYLAALDEIERLDDALVTCQLQRDDETVEKLRLFDAVSRMVGSETAELIARHGSVAAYLRARDATREEQP